MAMPRKGSRLIMVDEVVFRWRVRHKPTYSQGNGWVPLTFAVEHATSPGAVLMVTFPCARPDNWLGLPSVGIRPNLVAAYVRWALDEGWVPAHVGPAFSLTLTRRQAADDTSGYRLISLSRSH
ncbi:hypothetical protein [Rhizohabitans arisaemae]|uniref:hypothetical protein n=1 Tax=Rhizohabitans arisaemae TaxID=2720610 RepID=UPI0024B1FDF9|nr:hypothetical protein [Rhizohabitans arisaemae]